MDLDQRHLEQLDRVADRIAVVGPGAGVDHDAVRPVERVVAPVDVLTFAVRLPALDVQLELAGPVVDPRLELTETETAVQLGVPPPDDVEVDSVQDGDPHRDEP
jgi:hypothetical protein